MNVTCTEGNAVSNPRIWYVVWWWWWWWWWRRWRWRRSQRDNDDDDDVEDVSDDDDDDDDGDIGDDDNKDDNDDYDDDDDDEDDDNHDDDEDDDVMGFLISNEISIFTPLLLLFWVCVTRLPYSCGFIAQFVKVQQQYSGGCETESPWSLKVYFIFTSAKEVMFW